MDYLPTSSCKVCERHLCISKKYSRVILEFFFKSIIKIINSKKKTSLKFWPVRCARIQGLFSDPIVWILQKNTVHTKKLDLKRKNQKSNPAASSNPRGDEMKREVPFICNDGHKSLNGRDKNATRVYHTHALTKCSNACQSNKISSKRGSLQSRPANFMYV